MRRWTDEEIDCLISAGLPGRSPRDFMGVYAWEGYRDAAGQHIRELQNGVEELRGKMTAPRYEDGHTLYYINQIFWPADESDSNYLFTAGDWPCNGDNW